MYEDSDDKINDEERQRILNRNESHDLVQGRDPEKIYTNGLTVHSMFKGYMGGDKQKNPLASAVKTNSSNLLDSSSEGIIPTEVVISAVPERDVIGVDKGLAEGALSGAKGFHGKGTKRYECSTRAKFGNGRKESNNVRNKDYATFVSSPVIQQFPESRPIHTDYDIRQASSVDVKQQRECEISNSRTAIGYYSNLSKTARKIEELPKSPQKEINISQSDHIGIITPSKMLPRRESLRRAAKEIDTPKGKLGLQEKSHPQISPYDTILLSTLDNNEYENALFRDAHEVFESFVFPSAFPWNQPKALLLPAVPRDIDELQGVTYAEDTTWVSGAGYNAARTFGFGRYETGKQRKNMPHEQQGLLGGRIRCSARRAEDPGVIDLAVGISISESSQSYLEAKKVKLASEILSNNPTQNLLSQSEKFQRKSGLKTSTPKSLSRPSNRSILPPYPKIIQKEIQCAMKEGLRAEATSCLPWFWKKCENNDKWHLSAQRINNSKMNDDTANHEKDNQNSDFQAMRRQQRKKMKLEKIGRTNSKQWKLSVKVGAVSSRCSIFPATAKPNDSKVSLTQFGQKLSNTCKSYSKGQNRTSSKDVPIGNQREKNSEQTNLNNETHFRGKQKVKFATAFFPSWIQQGRSVSADVVGEYDANGVASSLGTYDCRSYSQPHDKQTSGKQMGRSKRLLIGRTRLVWSDIATGIGATRSNRTEYLSILTGKKLDSTAYKRPREVAVAVKIMGRLYLEADDFSDRIEDSDSNHEYNSSLVIASITKKRRRVCIDDKEETSKENSEENSKDIIKSKFCSSHTVNKLEKHLGDKLMNTLTHENFPSWSHTFCSFNRHCYITSLLKVIRRGRRTSGPFLMGSHDPFDNAAFQQPVALKYGSTNTLKFIPPRIYCLPLEDGPLRVFCLAPGSMHGSSVHHFLGQAAKRGNETPRCTVCWHGSGTNFSTKLHECIDCGLLAHPSCCFDEGEIYSDKTGQFETYQNWQNSNTNGTQNDDHENLKSSSKQFRKASLADGECLKIANNSPLRAQIDEKHCIKTPSDLNLSSGASSYLASPDLFQTIFPKWRCAVCCDVFKKGVCHATSASNVTANRSKSRRCAKIPARYSDTNMHIKTSGKRQTRPSYKCTLCPHSGGAMSVLHNSDAKKNAGRRWTHEICRIWCRFSPPTSIPQPEGEIKRAEQKKLLDRGKDLCNLSAVCCICGMGKIHNQGRSSEEFVDGCLQNYQGISNSSASSNQRTNASGLVKCAANGCHLSFHPLCAILASKLRLEDEHKPNKNIETKVKNNMDQNQTKIRCTGENNNLNPEEAMKESNINDAELCNQYTLQLMKVSRTAGGFGSIPGMSKSTIVPVAFCGLHNPKRDPSLYGCPPAGYLLNSAIDIPLQFAS